MATIPTATEFEIKPEHLKLLRRMWVCWEDAEFGAPTIDPKRPYGNSDAYGDIAEILGITPPERDGEFSQAQLGYMLKLHEETQTVLQIALRTGSFAVGRYRRPDSYGRAWARI